MELTDEAIRTRNALVLANRGFVYSHINEKWKGYKNTDHYQDIVSEGILALFKAAEKFDASMGNTFITYAVHWIDQRIRNYISTATIPVTMPPNRIGLKKAIEKAYREKSGNEKVSLFELLPEPMMQNAQIVISSIFSKSSATNIFLLRHDDSPSQLENILIEENASELMSAIKSLDDRSCKIVQEYYGIIGGQSMTLEQIGQVEGITRERVRQILKSSQKSLNFLVTPHFAKGIPNFDADQSSEFNTIWPPESLNDSAHKYFSNPNDGWLYDCPSCGDSTWNQREGAIACENCGFDSDAAPACPKCGEPVLLGVPCYCDFVAPRNEQTLRRKIHRILILASPCSVHLIASELEDSGFPLSLGEVYVRLQRDDAVLKGMDGFFYLRETAPEAILELDRIEVQMDEMESTFQTKSESLGYLLKVNRKNAVQAAHIRQDMLVLERDYLSAKEGLIARWEFLAKKVHRS